MFTSGSKLLFGIAAALTVAAVAYAIGSGDRLGGIVLAVAASAAVFLGSFLVGRVAPAGAEIAVPTPNRASQPLRPTMWPMLAAAAVTLFAVGVTLDLPTLVLGLVAIGVAGAGWFAEAVRERRPEADPAAVYAEERVIEPTGLPLLALLAIAVVVISVSRILLAVSKNGAVAVAIAVAGAIFVVAMVVSSRRAVSGRALAGLLALSALLLVAGGALAATEGERTIERHGGNPSATEIARGTAFVNGELAVSSDTNRVKVHFINEDEDVIHNITFFEGDSPEAGQLFFGDALLSTGETTYTFQVPEAGEYFYWCEFHPEQMTGTLVVEEPAHEGEGEEHA